MRKFLSTLLLAATALVSSQPAKAQSGSSLQGTAGLQGTAALSIAPAQPIHVSLLPASVTVPVNAQTTFLATMTGDSSNSGVHIQVSGPSCAGAACGTVSPSTIAPGTDLSAGVTLTYTSPASVPSLEAVFLEVQSLKDPNVLKLSAITVTPPNTPAATLHISHPPAQPTASPSNTFAITPTEGNGLVVIVYANDLDLFTGITDTAGRGDFYNAIPCLIHDVSGTMRMFYAQGLTPGITGIVVANSQASSTETIVAYDIASFSGIHNGNTALLSSGCTSSQGNAVTSLAGPTLQGQAGGIVIAGGISANDVTAAEAPFAVNQTITARGDGAAFIVPQTTQNFTPTFDALSGAEGVTAASFAAGTTQSGGGSGITMGLNPTAASVNVNANQNFTATVQNDTSGGGFTAVVTGAGCSGATCGTILAGGSRSFALSRTGFQTGVSALASMTIPIGFPTTGNAETVEFDTGSAAMTFTGVVDDKGNTYTQLGTETDSTCDCRISVWRSPSGTTLSGATQLTVTSSNPFGSVDMFFYDMTISPGTYTTQYSGVSNHVASANPTGPSVTTTASGIVIGHIFGGGVPTVASPFTLTGASSQSAYDITSAGGTFAPVWTQSNSTYAAFTYAITEDSALGSLTPGVPFVYKAPPAVPSPALVTLTVASVTDPSSTATAAITVVGSTVVAVDLQPPTASVQAGSTPISFTPTVSNATANPGVSITLTGTNCQAAGCGTLSGSSGTSGTAFTYTPPASTTSTFTATITVTSILDNTKSDTSVVTVNPAPTGGGGSSSCTVGNCPTFPGAQGGGAASVGGRGGVVIEVTNLNDSGTGSLRACATASGPRTCVFRVAGIISFQSQVLITNPFLTVAGQTAPGQIIIGGPTSLESFRISTHDVVIRYVTYSPDNFNIASGPSSGTVAYYIANTQNFNNIIDHCTSRWAGNKEVAIFAGFAGEYNSDFTMSKCLVYEPHAGHPVGPSISEADNLAITQASHNVDFHHNMFVNFSHRISEYNHSPARWINNITYNWYFYALAGLGATQTDAIGNIWKAGNLNANGPAQTYPIHSTDGTWPGSLPGTPSFYVAGNIGPGHTTPNTDQYGDLTRQITGENGSELGTFPSTWKRSTPLAASNPYPITVDPAVGLGATLIPTIGNSQHVDCNGGFVSHRDQADARIIAQYQNGTNGGFWPNGVGAPTTTISTPQTPWTDIPVVGFTVCTETLHDGIPDAWKTAHGIALNDATFYKRAGTNGYTGLENYMNGQLP